MTETQTIDIVLMSLDDAPGQAGPGEMFVEIEDEEGNSIRVGERIVRPDGMQAIRLEVVK